MRQSGKGGRAAVKAVADADSPGKGSRKSGVRKKPKSPVSRPGSGRKRGSKIWTSIWPSVFVFLLAVALRAIHLHQMDRYVHFQHPVLDAAYFDDWGRRIAAGDWIGSEIFFVDPLYSYFLGAVYKVFGHSLDAVRIIQMLIGGLTAVVIHRLGIRLLGGPAGFACGLIAACYRPFIFYDGLLLKSVLKAPLTALFLYFAVGVIQGSKNRFEGLLAGLALGLAALVRGNLLAMVPVTAAAFMFSGKMKPPGRLAAAVLLLVGTAVIIAPVTLRNHKVGGEWVLTASGMGQNMYIGNHPGNTTGSYVGAPFTRPNPDYEEDDFRAEAKKRTGRDMKPGELSRYWMRETAAIIADNPWRWIVHEGKKVWLLTHAVEIPDNYSFDFESKYSWVLRLPFPGFAILFPLGLAGAIAAFRDRKRAGLRFLVLFLAVYSVTLLPFFIISRYKVPMIPALIVLAVYGATAILGAFRHGELRKALALSILVVAIGIYTRQNPGWIPTSEIHFNFGTELKEQNLLAEAESQFREAIRLDPNYAEAYNNLGAVVNAQGREAEAAALFRKAQELKPDYWEADYNRASVAYRAGQYAEAGSLLERLIVARPDVYEVTLLMGLVRKREGRSDEALRLLRRAREIKPDATEAPYNEAMLLRDLGRTDEARRILTKLAEEHPEHETTRKALEAME